MTEKQKYFRLLSLVCEVLPTSAVDEAVRAGFPLGSVALQQVRVDRTINLAALVAMVQAGLPSFQIPAELLPAPTPQPLFD